ncbi:zinc finger protein 227-like [Chelonus insularis]|uniref:zinc finger protein 227-like n=1 Tax=Chelonus insularis TaxID=460826 RepID=UPI001588EDFC|nr:zinc finger protein 227-like [Chelonus insularis]
MSGYRRVNYYELCRLCTSSEGNKMNIFREEGRRRQLQTKIQTYLPIQVLEEDSLPKIVCHECVRKLESYIEFRDTVVSAEGMLESYFTSLRFSEDFLKEGKVYVKNTEKERPPSLEDPIKIEKLSPTNDQNVISESQTQHQQPVVVNNLNTSNIQIISGVQARVQQYKCAMQMQPGGVAAAVVEATAETHYSYQQQTSQQVSPQNQSSHGQSRLNEQQQQQQSQSTQQIQVQNQIQNQNQINQIQNQRQVTQQPNQQQRPVVQQPQNHCQMTQQIQHIREFDKQRLQQIEKQVQISPPQDQQQNQPQIVHQNNNALIKTDINIEQNQQVPLKSEIESQNINSPGENVQNFATVQASPEVFLSLGFKETPLNSQQPRDDKDFREYIKNSNDDPLSRNSIGPISEFLRLRSCPEQASLITVNPQVICQPSRNFVCQECNKTFENSNQLNSHQCPNSPMLAEITEINVKDDQNQNNGVNSFNCDVCGKPFKRKEHLFQHRKLHTGERPYVCTTCAKAFSRKEHLVRHSVSHTGQKMHECEMCGKSFSRKDNLHKHRKTHGVSGPYICETCGKSFVVKHYYLMHLTTHAPTIVDGENCSDPLPYKCDLCHKAFSVKEYLATHKQRHRSKNNSNHSNGQNQQQSQPQHVQQSVQSSATNGISVTTNNVTNNSLSGTNSQNNETPVVEIHNVIERNDSQSGQQHASYNNNQYHGNIQQFQ